MHKSHKSIPSFIPVVHFAPESGVHFTPEYIVQFGPEYSVSKGSVVFTSKDSHNINQLVLQLLE